MASKTKDAEVAETSEGKATHVEYVGMGREVKIRRITAADFKKIGVEDQNVVEFSRENQWKVPVGDEGLSSAAANALLERDPKNFKPASV